MSAYSPAESFLRSLHSVASDTKPSGPNDDAHDRWAAARCARILKDLYTLIDVIKDERAQWAAEKLAHLRRRYGVSSAADDHDASLGPPDDVGRPGGSGFSARWLAFSRFHDVRPAKRARTTYTAKIKRERQNSPSRTRFSEVELEMPSHLSPGGPKKLCQEGDHSERCPRDQCLRKFLEHYKLELLRDREPFSNNEEPKPIWKSLLDCISGIVDETPLGSLRVGTKSLFSACLRNLSLAEVAEAEEDGTELDNPRSEDRPVTHLYKDLEDFFCSGPSDSGWQPLKELVRYHVLHILAHRINRDKDDIENMIRFLVCEYTEDKAKMIRDSALSYVYMCHFSVWHIIEEFTMLTGQYGNARKRIVQEMEDDRYILSGEDDDLPVLHTGCNTMLFLLGSTRLTLVFSSVTAFGVRANNGFLDSFSPRIPSSRELVSCLNGAVAAITTANDDSVLEEGAVESAALLLRTVVRQSYLMSAFAIPDKIHELRLQHSQKEERQDSRLPDHRKEEPPKRTISDQHVTEDEWTCLKHASFNALAILLATELLRQSKSGKSQPHLCNTRVLMCLQQTGLEARQYLRLRDAKEDRGTSKDAQMILPLLAAGLATLIANDNATPIESSVLVDVFAMIELVPGRAAIDSAGSFLSKVALRCAQASHAETEFCMILDIFNHLDNARETCGKDIKARKVIADIKVTAASDLCHNSSQPDRQEWAIRISEAVNLEKVASTTGTPPCKRVQHERGYKWEEGISEWVERTPVPPVPKLKDSCDSDCEVSFDVESPRKTVPKRGMRKRLRESPIPESNVQEFCSTFRVAWHGNWDIESERESMKTLMVSKCMDGLDDLDELSIPNESILQVTNNHRHRLQILISPSRQTLAIETTRQDHKRTSLGLQKEAQEAGDMEDELC